MNDQKVKVAVVQAGSIHCSTSATIDKLEELASAASRKGAELVLFPEAFLGGYPRGETFGATVGSRTAEGRDAFRRYWEDAIDVPGDAVRRLQNIALKHRLYLVTGVLERGGGTIYCSVLFFGPDGAFLGKHRKLMPTAAERVIWGCGDGSTMPVFDTEIGKFGAVICWENYMPLMRFHMYAQGIQIYLAPTADNRPEWAPSMQHIAQEGRCFVLACNQFTTSTDYPQSDPQPARPPTPGANGGSCIVAPSGQFLVPPAKDGEQILYADLDFGEIARWKFDFDVAGHYSRPDVFQLHVDTSPKPVITSTGPLGGASHAVPAPAAEEGQGLPT
ncbi:MAG: carbon-nitrogen hydrolase family protein [Actinomycetia bacterium]|nr:carbon-nitrogen hydrolase family protein [Actinomycetes bacterium]